MKRNYLFFTLLLSLFVLAFSACANTADEQAPVKPVISTENSYIINLNTSRLKDGRTVVESTTKLYVKNTLKFTNVKVDTLPFLGTEKIKISDNDGNEKDTLIVKEYDVYTIIK